MKKEIKLKHKPSEIKKDTLVEMSNKTQKGLRFAILLALSDKKRRTEEEITELVNKITLTGTFELLRRRGLVEVSDNFDWLTEWEVKLIKMECPNCGFVWKVSKTRKKNCPKCDFELLKK